MVRPPLSFPDFAQRLTHILSRPAHPCCRSHIHTQIKSPQVTDFPLSRGYIITAVAVSFLVYCTLAAESLSPSSELAPYAPYFAPGNTVLSFLPSWSLQFSWGMVVFCHSFEALYVLHLCRKHRTGMFVGVSVIAAPCVLRSTDDVGGHRRSTSLGRFCSATPSYEK